MALVESSSDELVALVAGLTSVRMDDYAVVGSYMRFGERVREGLKDARLRIAEACAQPARRRDNHLLWAAPGSGKTYFVEQVAASLPDVAYAELNLAKLTESGFRDGLARSIAGGPTICLVDEVDAKPEEPWPYEALMPFLDVNLERGGGIVNGRGSRCRVVRCASGGPAASSAKPASRDRGSREVEPPTR